MKLGLKLQCPILPKDKSVAAFGFLEFLMVVWNRPSSDTARIQQTSSQVINCSVVIIPAFHDALHLVGECIKVRTVLINSTKQQQSIRCILELVPAISKQHLDGVIAMLSHTGILSILTVSTNPSYRGARVRRASFGEY